MMKHLLIALMLATPAWAQRGGATNKLAVYLPDCAAITGACPASGYVCSLSGTLYRCVVPSTWVAITLGPSANTPATGQYLRWDGTSSAPYWSDGTGGGGGGTSIIQESDVTVVSTADTLDFGAGFDVSESPTGEANVSLDFIERQIELGSEVSGVLGLANGGTNASDAATARTNLGVAASGANNDIESLTGLTTPLGRAYGGLGISTSGASDDQILVSSGSAWELKSLTDCQAGNQLLYTASTNTFGCEPDGASGTGTMKTVQEEGTPLTSDAVTMNFVGAALTASGTGTTKTITLSQSGSGTSVVDRDYTIASGAGLAGGQAMTGTTLTLATASQEAGFLADGGASALACGTSNQGKAQVMDSGVLQYCDGATTSALKTAAIGDSSGNAATGDDALGFFQTGALPIANGGTNATTQSSTYVMFYDGTRITGDSGMYYTSSTDTLNVGIVSTAGASDNSRYIEFSGNSGDASAPSSGNVKFYASGSAGSEALKYYTATGGIKTVATITGTETLTAKTIAGGSNDLSIRTHATDCTGLTDGVSGELCYEQDADTIYACEPSSGACDTAAEWRATSSAGSGDVTDVWNCSVGDCSSIVAAAGDTIDANAMTGADAFRLPYQANNTLSAVGAIGIDSTANQLVYYGSTVHVVPPTYSACAVLENLTGSDDDYEIWEAPYSVTILSGSCHCRGTCTSTLAGISFESRDGTQFTGTPTCSTGASASTYTSQTGSTTLASGMGLAFDVDTAPTILTDTYTICVTYRVDRQ